ncbi:hypothetical protein AN958_01950 [Leucoagaricus sp. SymC.cos]|nr:hypothetical protein AN958_01950 [Leucoagaricus sp. SymC.cos]
MSTVTHILPLFRQLVQKNLVMTLARDWEFDVKGKGGNAWKLHAIYDIKFGATEENPAEGRGMFAN